MCNEQCKYHNSVCVKEQESHFLALNPERGKCRLTEQVAGLMRSSIWFCTLALAHGFPAVANSFSLDKDCYVS